MKYSKDKKVRFEEDTHIYTEVATGKVLKSVTSLVKDFVPPFDREKISKAYAKKHGLKQEEVLASWDNKARESAQMGTDIHKIFEDYILTGYINDTGKWPKERAAIKVIYDLFESGRLEPVETELIVYNEDYAGQIDLIAYSPAKRQYFIFDYKTNKSITDENPWRCMLPPYDSYPDANYYHYALQQRIYQKLCKEYEIEDCYIIHIGEEDYDILSLPKIPTPIR